MFYFIYFSKQYLLRKKGIKSNQIAKNTVHNKEFFIEFLMKIATFLVVIVEVVSIVFNIYREIPLFFRFIGVIFSIFGVCLFAISVWQMRDNWRAGLARNDKRELVQTGVYTMSRNPAFLGFDLVYIGILFSFFNLILLFFTIFPIVMLHLQILQEERYLVEIFGEEYVKYQKKVGRYFGRKSVFSDV